ncbi:MAG: YdcF family protein [Candidatus Micrarchaeota archaeon]|nr:YdcF family protein [Candidatus Micrarchaeota archaeon]
MISNKAIVAVGEGLSGEGVASTLTIAAADTALFLLKRGDADKVIFAGGYGYRFKKRPPKSEAESMRDRLISKGVDSSKIRIESDSIDTTSNLYYAKNLMLREFPEVDEITLVASWQHMYRTRVVAEWVYGPGYKISWIPSPDSIWGDEMIYSMQAERSSLELVLDIWKEWNVVKGDHERIWEVHRATHPFHTKDPKISERQKEMMRKVDELRKHCKKFSENPDGVSLQEVAQFRREG